MTTKEIKQLDDVMLFAMQREKKSGFNFNEICRVCKAAFVFLPCYNSFKGYDVTNRQFFHEVLSYIENLENDGLAIVLRRGKLILRIDLTPRGITTLKQTIFTHQERMGERG